MASPISLATHLAGLSLCGLSAVREVFTSKPFEGISIIVYGNDTRQIKEVALTLGHFGAEVTHCSDSSGQYVYTRAPDLIIDYFGKATRLIHEGVKAEREFNKTGKLPDLSFNGDHELLSLKAFIHAGLMTYPNRYHKIKNKLIGLCDMTVVGIKKAYVMQAMGTLPFSVINVKGSIANSKFGDLDGIGASISDFLKAQNGHYTHQLIADNLIASQIMNANILRNHLNNLGFSDLMKFNGQNYLEEANLNFNNIHHHLPVAAQLPEGFVIRGKIVVVSGYGDKGKFAADAMRGAGAKVIVTEIDPYCALEAAVEKFEVRNLEDVVQNADVIITATGKKGTITVSEMAKMKDNTILLDIGYFDNEIDMVGLESCSSVKKLYTRHGVICYFPETKNAIRVLVLPDREPTSYTQTLGFIGLLALLGAKDIGKYKKEVCVLSKEHDEMVAGLYLEQLGAKLTKGASYITGSSGCMTVALDGQEYLRKRKASLMSRLALPEMKFKCA